MQTTALLSRAVCFGDPDSSGVGVYVPIGTLLWHGRGL